MAFRSVATLRINSTSIAQPMVGSYISAGIGAPSDVPLTITLGGLAAASSMTDVQAIFRPGDPVWLLNADGTNGEPAIVGSVALGAQNQMTLVPQQSSGGGRVNPVTTLSHTSGVFGTGTWILVKQMVNNVFVQLEDNTSSTYIYIGDARNMTATFRRIAKLPKVSTGQNPYTWSSTENFGGNPFDLSELWILGGSGNSNDGYTPSFNQV